MKYIYTIVLAIFLASCTSSSVENNEELLESPVSEVTNSEIDNELESLFTEEENEAETSDNVVKLDASYKNPAGDVDMVVSYSVDEEGKITYIEANATLYDVSSFNSAIQVLVGKTLDDAKEINVAGSSIATEAFTYAMKNN